MKRNSVQNLIKNNDLIFTNQEHFSYIIKGNDIANIKNIILNENLEANLLFVDCVNFGVKVIQKTGSVLNAKVLNKNEIGNSELSFDLMENATLSLSYADFSNGKGINKVDVNLIGDNSRCDWILSSISRNDDNKEFKVLIDHIGLSTRATANNYGVAKDHSRLVFSGASHIEKGSKKSKTKQDARIMVFSKEADAVAKPILKIDENDIEAGHSAVLGQVNEEHLFYLKSRGISEKEAKTLIVMGYIKPILKKFEDEEIKEEIEKLILERV
ncbi:hypothetical protein SDC9_100128 [bioreactor metagenome]|uniref:SUF system FeS cluster assembly SufBD core domain-containing protein n=1 Tax=bioreactor metagenome TaxID=1076179 RepID=A0A645AM16_9ZZZZ